MQAASRTQHYPHPPLTLAKLNKQLHQVKQDKTDKEPLSKSSFQSA
jgi:hypothetical protein